MEKQEIISLIVVVILVIPVIIFLYWGLLKLFDFALAYLSASVVAIGGILVWGFRHRIQNLIPKKSEIVSKPELTVEYDESNIRQYSPFVDGHRVLRIRVINNGNETAIDCEARVQVFDYNGNHLTEEIYVMWTKNNDTKSDIPKHDSVFLNVVFSTKDGIDGRLAFVAHPKSSDFSKSPRLSEGLKVSNYKLKIRIKPPNSDDALYVNFDLHVKENWREISMSKIDEYLSSE